MIRRKMLADWDHRAVKWSLIASALALTLGAFAENRLDVHAQKPVPTVDTVQVAPAPQPPVTPDAPFALRMAS